MPPLGAGRFAVAAALASLAALAALAMYAHSWAAGCAVGGGTLRLRLSHGDGDCLYRSVVHALGKAAKDVVGCGDDRGLVRCLRNIVADRLEDSLGHYIDNYRSKMKMTALGADFTSEGRMARAVDDTVSDADFRKLFIDGVRNREYGEEVEVWVIRKLLDDHGRIGLYIGRQCPSEKDIDHLRTALRKNSAIFLRQRSLHFDAWVADPPGPVPL